MQAREVILSARYILSDMNASRWSDDRLIALLNDGLTDISKTTILYVEEGYVKLINNLATYDVSAEVMKVLRIEYKNKPLKQTTFAELDKRIPEWMTKTASEIQAYTVDKQKEGHFRVYPIPLNAYNDNIDFSGNYGIITGVNYSDMQIAIEGTFGDLGAVTENEFVKLFFIRKPTLVNYMEDEIIVSSLALEPLAHYIAGRALRDNQDTQNRAVGTEELNFYNKMLDEYKFARSIHFTQAQFETMYNPSGA